MPKYPIIFVPGVAGSKLIAENIATQKDKMVWIHPSLEAGSVAAKYLWGCMDQKTGMFKSHLDNYMNLRAKVGLKGCDHLVEMCILKQISNYFGNITNYLCKHNGYEKDKSIFAFTYDWRQSVGHHSVQSQLWKLIKLAKKKNNNNKVILIGHSMGGLTIEQYIRQHTDWQDDIEHFIALMVPFDGVSGFAQISQLCGYNLRLPIPHCTAKGIQTSSIAAQFLFNRPMQESGGTFSQIYIKKLKMQHTYNKTYQNYVDNEDTQHLQNIKIEDITLFPKVYKNDVPDVLFSVAQKIYNNKLLIKPELLGPSFKFLQKGCKFGSIQIKRPSKQNSNNFIIDKGTCCKKREIDLVERDYTKIIVTQEDIDLKEGIDFDWEIYNTWCECDDVPKQSRNYQYKTNKFMVYENGHLSFTKLFYKIFEQDILKNQVRQSIFRDLKEYVEALQYYTEIFSKTKVKNNSQCCSTCAKPLVLSDNTPWTRPSHKQQISVRSLHQLVEKVHPVGHIERVVFEPCKSNYMEVFNKRTIPIQFNNNKSFKFTSICGSGTDTPLHAVYVKPVYDYEELMHQFPEFTNGNGDGTVLLLSALSDPFPDRFVNDRIVVNNFEHFPAMKLKELYKMVSKIICDIEK